MPERDNTMGKKARHLGLLLSMYIVLALLFILVFFDRMVITVPPGHVGVFYSRLFGGTNHNRVYGEGVHLILPWDMMYLYDCRSQRANYDVNVLIEGGLVVVVHSSIIWSVKPEHAPRLHTSVGPEYPDVLIAPAMTAGIRSSAGRRPDLYSRSFDVHAFAGEILDYVAKFLDNNAFDFDAVLIREIELPPEMVEAINKKFTAEQSVLEERYNVQRAYENFKRLYIDAESVRTAARIVNQDLSENFLRFHGIEATRKLAESNNAKLVIIGDKDGLPLILNPDTLPAGQAATGQERDPFENSDVPALRLEALSEYLGSLNGALDKLGDMPDFKADTLPQVTGTRDIKGGE
jgi:regulator of protease activity HflC (stomatin/prohibitin superfamily)